MITIEKKLDLTTEYDLRVLGDPEKILFFDIETTGLSAHNSSVYLIGCLSYEDDAFFLRQFMAESFSEEQKIICCFLELLKHYDALVHFNGDTFDLKYLSTAASQYGLSFDLTGIKSIDIYKRVRKHKQLFRLTNYKQKTIEQFLKIDREDLYTGGELISVYESYTKSRDPEELRLLLLHNREDLEGLIHLLPILSYDDVLNDPEVLADFTHPEIKIRKDSNHISIRLDTCVTFPHCLEEETERDIYIRFENAALYFEIPFYAGTLKHFYKDYKNYWYLPKEDFAVHKKLAQFVDKEYRQPASKETAYGKKEGLFLPAMACTHLPVFYEKYASEPYNLLAEESLEKYLTEILKTL